MLYQFFKKTDNTNLGIDAEPNWIYMQENGYYGLTDYEHCEGVAIDGIPYHLEGREGLSDLETVYFKETTQAEYIATIQTEQREMLDILTGEVTINEDTE